MFSFQGTVLWINSRFQFLTIKNWNPASIRENKWWAKVDSNHRPHDYQSCALTSWAISPHFGKPVSIPHPLLVEMRRIELLTPCVQSRCSPSWATPPYQRLWTLAFASPFWRFIQEPSKSNKNYLSVNPQVQKPKVLWSVPQNKSGSP